MSALEVVVADDMGNAALTPVAVGGLLEAGADVVSGVIGSANNLAVRTQLNRACVPQLMSLATSERLGEVVDAPWTMGGQVPEGVETTIYVNSISRSLGEDATVGLLVDRRRHGSRPTRQAFLDRGGRHAGVDHRPADRRRRAASMPPSIALITIADKRPEALVASLAGAACATFLTELAKVEASLGDWHPAVYMSGGCADTTILRLAGDAADGVLTAANLTTDQPDFLEAMTAAGVTTGLAGAAEGWTAAEVTVAIIRQAAASPAGLTRESIINAARRFEYTPSLARPGVRYRTEGTNDPFPAESLQIVRYDAATESFVDVGTLIAQFES